MSFGKVATLDELWIGEKLGLVVGGNGLVVLAERTVPSGQISLIIALVPLWMALIDAVLLNRRVGRLTTFGLILGFAGAATLIGTSAFDATAPLTGLMIGVVASLSWTSASLYSRNAPLPKRPLVGAGMEMLVGGAVLIVLGIARGELSLFHPEDFSRASLLALLYLVTVADEGVAAATRGRGGVHEVGVGSGADADREQPAGADAIVDQPHELAFVTDTAVGDEDDLSQRVRAGLRGEGQLQRGAHLGTTAGRERIDEAPRGGDVGG